MEITLASDYWSANVYQQVSNSFSSSGSPYGKKGDTRWQMIALSEGWSNYREWKLAKTNLGGYNIYGKYNDGTPKTFYDYKDLNIARYYGSMFEQLNNIGCKYYYLEKSICTYSIVGYKDNLISYYPTLKNQITNIIKNYE